MCIALRGRVARGLASAGLDIRAREQGAGKKEFLDLSSGWVIRQ